MKILLTNIYNLNNLGTQADFQTLLKLFKGKLYIYSFPIFLNEDFMKSNKVIVLSKESKNFMSLLKNSIENILMVFLKRELFRKIDIAIDLGGDTLNDTNYSIFHPFIYLMNLFPALVYSIPIVIFSQSIGPIKSSLNRYLTKFILRKATVIIVRESFSHKFLTKILRIDENKVLFLPPIAFLLYKSDKKMHKKNYVALFVDKNLSNIMGKKRCLLFYKQVISVLLENFEKVFILGSALGPSNLPFPLKKINDYEIFDDLKREIKDKKIFYIQVKNLADLNRILRKCSVSVCSKFHPIIFSLGSGVAPLVISYNKKTEYLMKDFQLASCLLKYK